MESFGVSLSDVADNCPKQQRTLLACRKALAYARENSWLLEELVQGKKLPLAKLSDGSGVERKTLERHRKYLVAEAKPSELSGDGMPQKLRGPAGSRGAICESGQPPL